MKPGILVKRLVMHLEKVFDGWRPEHVKVCMENNFGTLKTVMEIHTGQSESEILLLQDYPKVNVNNQTFDLFCLVQYIV